jgi:hypothetical protein
MTGANGGVDPATRPEWQWNVALSFVGAQREYVGQVAEALEARPGTPMATARGRQRCGVTGAAWPARVWA